MSNNAFNTQQSKPLPSQSSPVLSSASSPAAMSNDQKIMWAGGVIIAVLVLFIVLNSSKNTDNKASLLETQTVATTEQVVVPQKTEVVYKDQNGNILTSDQVQQILHPKEETVVVAPNPTDTVKYPEITISEEEKKAGEAVQINTDKKLFVKQEDAAKLLAEKRLVKKIVDNRPLYVEPISGSVVELIQPIVRERIGTAPAMPVIGRTPKITIQNISSGEVTRKMVSTGEAVR